MCKIRIAGLTKTTLLDYPGLVAATIFTYGCDFACPFCHNKRLIPLPRADASCKPELIDTGVIFDFLRKRKNVLAGVCVSGGEPTLQSDLLAFLQDIKAIGYLVKLDTNGYHPEVIAKLLASNVLDYVAMDIKNTKEKYAKTSGLATMDIKRIDASIEHIKNAGIPYEFRTTVARELHAPEDLRKIGEWLRGAEKWYLQSCREVAGETYAPYGESEMNELLRFLWEHNIENARLRDVSE